MLEEFCNLPSPDDLDALRSKKRQFVLNEAIRHIKDCIECQYMDDYILVHKNNLASCSLKFEIINDVVTMLRLKGWNVKETDSSIEIRKLERL